MSLGESLTSISRSSIVLLIILFFVSEAHAEVGNYSIEEASLWDVRIIDGSTGLENENVTISSGDIVLLSIELSQNSAGNDSWEFSFGFNGQWYGGNSGMLTEEDNSLIEIQFGPVYEGNLLCKLELINSEVVEILDLRIGPNPINFTAAGTPDVAIIGQPAHVGDELVASLLVHNNGENGGEVELGLYKPDGSIISIGNPIYISPGSSREVSTTFLIGQEGQHSIDWKIISSTGGVSINLNGTMEIVILEAQQFSIQIVDMDWTINGGLIVNFELLMGDGKDRNIDISIQLKNNNEYSEFQSINLEMSPGIRVISVILGHPDGERLQIIGSANGWIASEGDAIIILELQPPVIIPTIESGSIIPAQAILSESISINYWLNNSGTESTQIGIIRIVNVADNLILAEQNVSPVGPGGSFSSSLSIPSWSYSQTVDLEIIWLMEGLVTSKQISVATEEKINTGIVLPFNIAAAVYGALSGLSLVMASAVVYRAFSQRTPSTTDAKSKRSSETRISRRNQIDSKKEIQCPGCNQRLNIPSSHEGDVKCPACTQQFPVINSQTIIFNDSENKESQLSENIEPEQNLTSKSTDDILSCPTCDQVLRVPIDKRPIRSRCPACRSEFISEVG
jgi:uncharacterized protein YbaR (Trm112 family)